LFRYLAVTRSCVNNIQYICKGLCCHKQVWFKSAHAVPIAGFRTH